MNSQHRYKNIILGRAKSYFLWKKTPLWFYQKVLWNWCHQNARVFDRQHICYIIWWTWFATESRHSHWYKLFSPSRRLHSLFVRGRLHTGASKEKQKNSQPGALVSRSAI